MATRRAASRVRRKPSLRWSWSRLPLHSYFFPNLANFSLNICPNSGCRFPAPPLLSMSSNPSSFNPRLTSSVHAKLFWPFDQRIVSSGPLFLSSPIWQLLFILPVNLCSEAISGKGSRSRSPVSEDYMHLSRRANLYQRPLMAPWHRSLLFQILLALVLGTCPMKFPWRVCCRAPFLDGKRYNCKKNGKYYSCASCSQLLPMLITHPSQVRWQSEYMMAITGEDRSNTVLYCKFPLRTRVELSPIDTYASWTAILNRMFLERCPLMRWHMSRWWV